MKLFRLPFILCYLALISACSSNISLSATITPQPTSAPQLFTTNTPEIKIPTSIPTRQPGILLPVRCLYVSFDKRGYPSGYYSGDVISNFNQYDPVVGHTIKEEMSLQLDEINKLGVNSIAFELRSSDPVFIFEPFTPPNCNISPALGLQYPQPTVVETSNLVEFLDLLESKGMKVYLRLVNTHMEEQPPLNNKIWLGTILKAIKNHPALALVLFEGNQHTLDSNGDGKGDICGIPAEPPLWDGSNSIPADYIKWAIDFAHSLGFPYQQLSTEAVVGDFSATQPEVSGYWNTVLTLMEIFDAVNIPEEERTYAISLYERPKCAYSRIPCEDEHPHLWAIETMDFLFETIGTNTKSKVVFVEMGLTTNLVLPTKDRYFYEPVIYKHWNKELAMHSLVWLMQAYGVDGGCFWAWSNTSSMEEVDPVYGQQVKRRGPEFEYNPLKDVVENLYTYGQYQTLNLSSESIPPVFHNVSVEPAILENGDPFKISAIMEEPFIFVLVDLSELDSSQTNPVALIDQGGGVYQAISKIQWWNINSNGKKTIPLWAMDFWGNISETTIQVDLANPSRPPEISQLDDEFSGRYLDTDKWQASINGGEISISDRVMMKVESAVSNPNPTLFTRWAFVGDFDVQVDFEIGEGWATPKKEHIDGATLGVVINGQSYHITRLRDLNEDTFFTWSNTYPWSLKAYTNTLTGQYRLIRKGSILYLLYNSGHGWNELTHISVPTLPAQVYLAMGSVNAAHTFTSYFDNFVVNSGTTYY